MQDIKTGQNVFIDFKIIEQSDKLKLAEELDVLLRANKKIFVWSKEKTPLEMRKYCTSIKIPVKKEEIEVHKKVKELRSKKKTYETIAKELNIEPSIIGYYVNTPVVESNSLDEWIIDYYEKDPCFYDKADIILDPDSNRVRRFTTFGRNAIYIEKII